MSEYATAITIAFILLSALVAAFIRRTSRDKCLKAFAHDMVTIEEVDGDIFYGKLNVENTGLELIYEQAYTNENAQTESSYLTYKNEYAKIQLLVRYHDQLTDDAKMDRDKELKVTYHPTFSKRLARKTANVFKTIRDSIMEVVDMMMSHAKKATPAGGMLTSQDKYVTRMKKDLAGSVGTSYEPLLEKYIGRIVTLEFIRGDNVLKISGVLKDYTATFIEMLDVDYKTDDTAQARKADIIVPRKYGIVRYLGE